jgi:hypothetical protein
LADLSVFIYPTPSLIRRCRDNLRLYSKIADRNEETNEYTGSIVVKK